MIRSRALVMEVSGRNTSIQEEEDGEVDQLKVSDRH